MASFSPYGHDLRMLTYAPPSTWEPCFPGSPPSQGSILSHGVTHSYSSSSYSSSMDRSSLPASTQIRSLSACSSFQQSPLSAPPPRPNAQVSPLNLPVSRGPPASHTCHLLALPPELLDQIFDYVLPYTTPTSKSIAWVRRSTALLATCRTLHEAGTRHLYGTNIFELATSFTGTLWRMRWIQPFPGHRAGERLRVGAERSTITVTPLNGDAARNSHSGFMHASSRTLPPFLGTPYPGETYLPSTSLSTSTEGRSRLANSTSATLRSGARSASTLRSSADANSVVGGSSESEGISGPLVPSRPQPFPGALPARYRTLLRFVAVEIRMENEYTGRIKYGFGGPGLVDGVRGQVQRLADVLNGASELRRVVVQLVDCDGDSNRDREKEREKVTGSIARCRFNATTNEARPDVYRDKAFASIGSGTDAMRNPKLPQPNVNAQALESILQPLRTLGRKTGCDIVLLARGEEFASCLHGLP